MIGKIVKVIIDRPLGSRHPVYRDTVYPLNYGYIEGLTAGDGEYQDAYVLGVDHAAEAFTGRVIAVIHRLNDVEDKLVVAPDGVEFSQEEIEEQVHFQVRYFKHSILL